MLKLKNPFREIRQSRFNKEEQRIAINPMLYQSFDGIDTQNFHSFREAGPKIALEYYYARFQKFRPFKKLKG